MIFPHSPPLYVADAGAIVSILGAFFGVVSPIIATIAGLLAIAVYVRTLFFTKPNNGEK